MDFKAINPLHHIIQIAELNNELWQIENENNFSKINLGDHYLTKLPIESTSEPFPHINGYTIYPSIEKLGVAGLFNELKKRSNYEVIFSNDLAYEIHGIDAIAYDPSTEEYLICEAKGTRRAIKNLLFYLKKTKQKGRQLSWEWCWASLIDFAEFPPTANVFLELYDKFISNKNVSRLLSVTKGFKYHVGYIIRETKLFFENELHKYDWLTQTINTVELHKWIGEIDRSKIDNKTTIANIFT